MRLLNALKQSNAKAYGYERCRYDTIFVFDKSKPNYGDDASSLVYVGKNDGGYEKYEQMEEAYPIDDYWVIGGTVSDDKEGNFVIKLYLS